MSDELEDDSILTQVVKVVEEEPDLDMTLPLEKCISRIEHESDDEFEKTLIPQLDGVYDDCISVSYIYFLYLTILKFWNCFFANIRTQICTLIMEE